MSDGLLLILVILALCWTSTLHAQEPPLDWSQTFTPKSLLPYVHDYQHRWVVAPAGSDRQTGRAALTLQTALHAIGKIEQIVDGESLGIVDRLSDQEIVQRAARLAVDTVVVVRLLGHQSIVVLNIYNLQGEMLSTARAKVGVELPPPPNVSIHREQALDDANSASLDTARLIAEQEFAAQHIGFVGIGPADGGVAQTTLRIVNAYRGEEQQQLPPREFYILVGRPELAAEYERRRHAALYLIGGAGIAGGLSAIALAATTASLVSGTPGGSTEFTPPDLKALTAGVAISALGAITGLVLVSIGIVKYLDRHPVPTNESLRLATEYNRRLRRRLGLQAALMESLHSTTINASVATEQVLFTAQLHF